MTSTDEVGNFLTQARGNVHKLAGLLSGVSAGLYCTKIAEDMPGVMSCVVDVQKLVDEASEELTELRSALHAMGRSLES